MTDKTERIEVEPNVLRAVALIMLFEILCAAGLWAIWPSNAESAVLCQSSNEQIVKRWFDAAQCPRGYYKIGSV